MLRLSRTIVAVLLVGCGSEAAPSSGSGPPATSTPAKARGSADAGAKASAKPTAHVSAASATTPVAPASASAAPASGEFKFTAYNGPIVKKAIETKRVWAIVPVGLGDEWDILKIAVYDYDKTEGDFAVLTRFDKTPMLVPTALVEPTTPVTGLAKGDAVRVDVAASSAMARVTDVTKEKIKVHYVWVTPSDATLSPEQVIKVEDKVAYGQPVAYKKDGKWYAGIHAGGDAAKVFVLQNGGRAEVVEATALRAMTVTKTLAKGEEVWAAQGNQLEKAKIAEVSEGGTQYKVKMDAGSDATVTFDHVTKPLE